MTQLPAEQRELIFRLTERLSRVPGMQAVVLAGSYARGRAQKGSDIDLGLLYSDAAPFAIERVREIAEECNDTPNPVVTDFYQWGPWVNGGAWLAIGGQRVDFLYRSLEHTQRVIQDAIAGRYEVHALQQPPFGYFSGTYLGEVAICVPLFDPNSQIAQLKRGVAEYPEALRQTVIRDFLFMAEFNLTAFAPKFAARGDVYGTAACLARAAHEIGMALFAVNRTYPVNDKTALTEVSEFARAPRQFAARVQAMLAHLGNSAEELKSAVAAMDQLRRETTQLAVP